MDRAGRRPDGDGRAQRRARRRRVYDAIDRSGGFYRGHAEPESRSQMNVTFRLPSEALEKQFVAEAQAAGMVGLAGHRSVGGIRASLYNAVEPGSVPGAGVVHGRLRPAARLILQEYRKGDRGRVGRVFETHQDYPRRHGQG